MTNLCCKVLKSLLGKTLVTAESCTGGGIGAALTAIAGSSEVYKGGVICYTDWVKANILGVDEELLRRYGAVSELVAGQMASGVRKLLNADVAVSVTGLAGPGGDDFGNPVGTVYIGLSCERNTTVKKFQFDGDRETVRQQAILEALNMILEFQV
jgi:PncC family amidohydrolase